MRAGHLRHRIVIQQSIITRDSYGQPVASWVSVATVWAAIEPLSGRELIAAQAVQSEITTRISLRYLPGITSAMRVVHGTRIYNIKTLLNLDERNRELQLMCSEGLNDG